MKLYRVFLIALMTSAFAVVGCGDDTTTSGNGGGDASTACSTCDAPDRIPECEARYDACIANPPSGNAQEKCTVLALEECGAL